MYMYICMYVYIYIYIYHIISDSCYCDKSTFSYSSEQFIRNSPATMAQLDDKAFMGALQSISKKKIKRRNVSHSPRLPSRLQDIDLVIHIFV